MMRVVAALLLVLLGAGCPPSEPPPSPPVAKAVHAARLPASAQAAMTYQKSCAPCHGQGGQGDGPDAAKLATKPRAWASPGVQKSFTDEGLRDALGTLSHAAHQGQPALTDAQKAWAKDPALLDAMVQVVRGFGPPAPATK